MFCKKYANFMKLIDKSITKTELTQMADAMFGNLVKAVVDVDKEIMVVDAELHSDEEAFLLESGSKQENLWGINLYPDNSLSEFIEFDSMINLRPSQGNTTRSVDDEGVRDKITLVIRKLVKW